MIEIRLPIELGKAVHPSFDYDEMITAVKQSIHRAGLAFITEARNIRFYKKQGIGIPLSNVNAVTAPIPVNLDYAEMDQHRTDFRLIKALACWRAKEVHVHLYPMPVENLAAVLRANIVQWEYEAMKNVIAAHGTQGAGFGRYVQGVVIGAWQPSAIYRDCCLFPVTAIPIFDVGVMLGGDVADLAIKTVDYLMAALSSPNAKADPHKLQQLGQRLTQLANTAINRNIALNRIGGTIH